MARSSYIYVVCINSRVAAAFTVKHELKKRLTDWWGQRIPQNVTVLRVADNGRLSERTDISADAFGLKEDN